MNLLTELTIVFGPWLAFLAIVFLAVKMTTWAKKRKAGAITFGVLVQMFIPDPKAQITIEAVAERKQEVKKQQEGDARPLDDEA